MERNSVLNSPPSLSFSRFPQRDVNQENLENENGHEMLKIIEFCE